ncbi:MAG TPA: hypothetical protein EYP36_12420 [Calditrichaeota bacterium]|nr:hypothetical protein [Calditrichota bacterium]
MRYFSIIALILISANILFAQFSKNIEVSSYWDDNLYRSPQPVNDLLTDVGIQLSYRPDDSNLNYYYNGSLFLYQNNSLRNFSAHDVGINYFNPFGQDDRHKFYLGAEWTLRLNGDEYNYYDYNQIYAYSNFRLDLDWLFLRGGYNFRYRSYSNLPDLTNYRHYLFLQANKSFATRTTFILETDLGYKSFAAQDFFIASGGMGGKGHRRMTDNYSSTTSVSEIPSLGQVVLLARISQSLHEKVGLFVQYRRQFSLTDETNFVNADGYYQDEELFDDPFSYESESYSTQLTWMLPWAMKLQIGGALISKNYISEQAYTSAEDSLALGGIRLDERGSYYVNFSKTLYLNKNWLKSLNFNLKYSYIRNESNSYWYDYKNAVFGGGIQWNF